MVLEVQNSRFLRPFTRALPGFLQRQRWFAGKAKRVSGCDARDIIRLTGGPDALYFFLIQVDFIGGDPQVYALPLQEVSNPSEAAAAEAAGFGLRIEPEENGDRVDSVVFADAIRRPGVADFLLSIIGQGSAFRGAAGELAGAPTNAFSSLRGPDPQLAASLLTAEQSNTSIVLGRRLVLKIFRLVEEGINPEIEVCSFLTERTSFANFAAVAGALEFRQPGKASMSLGVLQAFVPNQGDAWDFTLASAGAYFDRASARGASELAAPAGPLLALSGEEPPPAARELIGDYLDSAALLGRRTAELHLALASDARDPAFSPEPFTPDNQRSLHASLMGLVHENLGQLRDRSQDLAGGDLDLARHVLRLERDMRTGLDQVLDRKMTGLRTRIHGDYHLGQVLYTGSDFAIIDFEGEPARPLHERRLKNSPLRDVAGMLRSFHYAAHSVVLARAASGEQQAVGRDGLDAWARYWHVYVSAAFLKSYLNAAQGGSFLPMRTDELQLLLGVFVLEKAIYELGYELNHRTAWVRIPLEGILQTLAVQTQIAGH